MSHFIVLVIGDDPEAQLEPFDENAPAEPYEDFWDDEALQSFKEHYKLSDEALDKLTPEVQKAAKDWCGKELHKGVNCFYTYSTYNPESKWDWYQIGGRWSGYFKLKDGASGRLGRPGVFDNMPEPGWVDQVEKGDVDFAGMRKEAEERAAKEWDKVYAVAKPYLPAKSWQEVRAFFGGDLEGARKFYHEQPVMKAIKEAGLEPLFECPLTVYRLNEPDGRATYIHKAGLHSFVPFAVLYEGSWHERGNMGWFGIVTNEKEEDAWEDEVFKLLEGLPDDTLLTAVDCHI